MSLLDKIVDIILGKDSKESINVSQESAIKETDSIYSKGSIIDAKVIKINPRNVVLKFNKKDIAILPNNSYHDYADTNGNFIKKVGDTISVNIRKNIGKNKYIVSGGKFERIKTRLFLREKEDGEIIEAIIEEITHSFIHVLLKGMYRLKMPAEMLACLYTNEYKEFSKKPGDTIEVIVKKKEDGNIYCIEKSTYQKYLKENEKTKIKLNKFLKKERHTINNQSIDYTKVYGTYKAIITKIEGKRLIHVLVKELDKKIRLHYMDSFALYDDEKITKNVGDEIEVVLLQANGNQDFFIESTTFPLWQIKKNGKLFCEGHSLNENITAKILDIQEGDNKRKKITLELSDGFTFQGFLIDRKHNNDCVIGDEVQLLYNNVHGGNPVFKVLSDN